MWLLIHLGSILLGPHGGHMYNLYNFESPTPKDDHWQVLLKSDHGFFFKEDDENMTFSIKTPPQTIHPCRGLKEPSWELS